MATPRRHPENFVYLNDGALFQKFVAIATSIRQGSTSHEVWWDAVANSALSAGLDALSWEWTDEARLLTWMTHESTYGGPGDSAIGPEL